MGRKYMEHKGGEKIFVCRHCSTYLTNKREITSMRFTGSTGPAYLFQRAWNITTRAMETRTMMTGVHAVRDVNCANCDSHLGWMYEMAFKDDQRYKEAQVILEKELIEALPGITDGAVPRLGASIEYEKDVTPIVETDAKVVVGCEIGAPIPFYKRRYRCVQKKLQSHAV